MLNIAYSIYENYANDMGNYFDYIQTNEEDIQNEIKDILKHGTITEKIKLIKGGL